MRFTLAIIASVTIAAQAVAQWPTFHGNSQRTGRSVATGPATANILWSFDLNGPMINSPVVGPDGTVYTGSVWFESLVPTAYITAVNPNGSLKWRFETGFFDDQSVSTPALGPEGNLYVGTAHNIFYALNSSGQEIWRHQTLESIETHPVVAPNGTVYAKLDGFLIAFSPAGQIQWQFPIGSNTPGSPTLATDGTIYVPGSGGLFAINPNGTQKWKYMSADTFATPSVADNGTIYYPAAQLHAVNPTTGVLIWQAFAETSPYTAPAIDAQGNIYVHGEWELRKISPGGQILWERTFLYEGNRLEMTWSAPLVDAANRIYFGLGTGKRYSLESAKGLVAYDSNGNKLYNLLLPETPSSSAPAMGADGTIYIGCLDGKLYAIGDAWQQVSATSMNLVRGQIVGGGLSELHTSNDQYLQLRPGVTFSSSQRPIVLDLETTAPNSSPAGMQIVIESRASGNNIRQWVELYNFTTNQWVEVDSRVAPTTDVRIAIPVTNQAQFIEAGTRRMTARISYKAEGPVFAYPWTIRIDQATWNVR